MDRKAELDRALGAGHGMVGQRLLSETEAVRVWRIELKPELGGYSGVWRIGTARASEPAVPSK